MFQDNLNLILKYEGGFSDNKNDPGGRTNFGITQDTYDAYNYSKGLGQADVKNITQEEVANIYQRDYWHEGKCDKFENFMPATALCHFDCGVNQGVETAARLLQRAINLESPANLTVDGLIGPKTILAMSSLFDSQLCSRYLQLRKDRYDNLIKTRPMMAEFQASWYHRLNDIAKHGNLQWRAF